jgi:hypothetical protein
MLPPVCFETGRFTQTQSSWTVLRYCSRKWMSGQAAALALLKDRRLVSAFSALRETPSAGGPASPLDFYLSWMSPVYPSQKKSSLDISF